MQNLTLTYSSLSSDFTHYLFFVHSQDLHYQIDIKRRIPLMPVHLQCSSLTSSTLCDHDHVIPYYITQLTNLWPQMQGVEALGLWFMVIGVVEILAILLCPGSSLGGLLMSRTSCRTLGKVQSILNPPRPQNLLSLLWITYQKPKILL